jgi:caspase domain-containing protein
MLVDVSLRAILMLSVVVVLLAALAAGAQAPPRGPRQVIRRRRSALALVLSALLAATATAQTAAPERPTYAVGDAWSLTEGAYRLARIERGGAYVFTAAGDREIWLTRDLAVTYVKRGSDTIEIQDPPRVSWPLTAGKRGAGRSAIRLPGGIVEVYATWRVDGPEPVTTAGGAFDAFRIRYLFDPEIPGQFSSTPSQRYGSLYREAKFEMTLWYAPSVRRLVRSESSRALLAFELGGGQIASPAPPAATTPRPAPSTPPPAPPVAVAPAPPARPAAPPALPASPPPPPAVAETPPEAKRDAYAVIIGIGRYENPKIPALKYAVADAEAMYAVLTGPAGFSKDKVMLLTDRTERKPTLRNIKYALGNFLARAAQRDDMVIIYFAGHGAPEIDQRGVEQDGLAKYLLSSDADPDDLFSTALPMDDLQTIFGRIEAERVVVFIDTCFSGAAGGRTFMSQRTRAVNVDDLFLDRLTRSKGRAIISASRPNELSIELAELGHGVFTYYLAEGLKGAGDLNRDGIVTLQELYEYLESEVVRKARNVGGNQHPVLKGELQGVLPLTKVRGR